MTYQQNELAIIQRQQLRITALESELNTTHRIYAKAIDDNMSMAARVVTLQNMLATAHTDLAQRDDRIADLVRQLVSAGEFHLQSVDQATDFLTQERDGLQSECNRLVAMIADLVKKYDPARVYGPNVITALPEAIEQLQIDAQVAREEFHRMKTERDQARAVAREMADQCHDGEGFCRICIGRRGTHAPGCPVSKVRAWDASATPPSEDPPGFSAAHNPDV